MMTTIKGMKCPLTGLNTLSVNFLLYSLICLTPALLYNSKRSSISYIRNSVYRLLSINDDGTFRMGSCVRKCLSNLEYKFNSTRLGSTSRASNTQVHFVEQEADGIQRNGFSCPVARHQQVRQFGRSSIMISFDMLCPVL